MSTDETLRRLERQARHDPIAARALNEARARLCLEDRVREGWRLMTEGEVRMARALGGCRFSPGSVDKRIGRTLSAQARAKPPQITGKQARMLVRKVERYRRQIPAEVVELARLHVPCCTCLEPYQVNGHAPWCGTEQVPAMPLFDRPEATP